MSQLQRCLLFLGQRCGSFGAGRNVALIVGKETLPRPYNADQKTSEKSSMGRKASRAWQND